jgi:hypothetical protein
MTQHSTTQRDDDRADYAERLVAHRCPELADADLAQGLGKAETVPADVLDRVLDVLDVMEARLTRLERADRRAA